MGPPGLVSSRRWCSSATAERRALLRPRFRPFAESDGPQCHGPYKGFLNRFRSTRTATPHRVVTGSPSVVAPRLAVIDVETTGLSPQDNRIEELAVVTTDSLGQVIDEWTSRIHPDGPVGATHIHGITDADVASAPKFHDIAGDLARHLAGAAFVAHNAPFDLAFLTAEFGRAGWDMPNVPSLCTLHASQEYLPMLDRRRLADCCYAVGIPLHGAHSALGDARAAAGLVSVYANPRWNRAGFTDLTRHVATVAWPTAPARERAPWQSPHVSAFFAPKAPPAPSRMRLSMTARSRVQNAQN
ncbi:MAG: 3'-5' exonuclease [Solirubrobacteraceae bacterium]